MIIKKALLISGIMFSTVAAFAQITNAPAITVTDLPTSISAVFHYLGITINPVYLGLLLHFLAKYYRNYHIQDKLCADSNVFEKIASLVALTPLKRDVAK